MYSKDISASHLARLIRMCWLPLAMRDVMFRSTTLTFYYLTTEIEHKPLLKYSIPQITDFMKQRRMLSEMQGTRPETVFDLSHIFYEFHNFDIKSKMTTRVIMMWITNAFVTLLTNPIDVCLSKMAT